MTRNDGRRDPQYGAEGAICVKQIAPCARFRTKDGLKEEGKDFIVPIVSRKACEVAIK